MRDPELTLQSGKKLIKPVCCEQWGFFSPTLPPHPNSYINPENTKQNRMFLRRDFDDHLSELYTPDCQFSAVRRFVTKVLDGLYGDEIDMDYHGFLGKNGEVWVVKARGLSLQTASVYPEVWKEMGSPETQVNDYRSPKGSTGIISMQFNGLRDRDKTTFFDSGWFYKLSQSLGLREKLI